MTKKILQGRQGEQYSRRMEQRCRDWRGRGVPGTPVCLEGRMPTGERLQGRDGNGDVMMMGLSRWSAACLQRLQMPWKGA